MWSLVAPGMERTHQIECRAWLKKLSVNDLAGFASVSFIDQDGWLSRCPIDIGP